MNGQHESKIIKTVETAFTRELKSTVLSKNSYAYIAARKCVEFSYNNEFKSIMTFIRPANRSLDAGLISDDMMRMIDIIFATSIDKVIAMNIEKNISRNCISPNDYIAVMNLYGYMNHADDTYITTPCYDDESGNAVLRFKNSYASDLIIDTSCNDMKVLMKNIYNFIHESYEAIKHDIISKSMLFRQGILKNGNGVPDVRSAKGYMLNIFSQKIQENSFIGKYVSYQSYKDCDDNGLLIPMLGHEIADILSDLVITVYPELTDIHVIDTAEMFASPLKLENHEKFIDSEICMFYFGAVANITGGECFDSDDYFIKITYSYKFKDEDSEMNDVTFSTTFNEIKNFYNGDYLPKFTDSLYTFISTITNIIYS